MAPTSGTWVVFFQRLVLLVVGSILTYFVSRQVMRDQQEQTASTSVGTTTTDKQQQARTARRWGLSYDGLSAYEKDLLSMIVAPETVRETFEDVVGLARPIELIRKMIVEPLRDDGDGSTQKNRRKRLMMNGMILHGVPGTGKTLLARATANALDRPFLQFDIASVEDKYVGESNRRLRAVFTLVRKLKGRCVVFFDEFDGIASRRNYQMDQHHVNSLKTCLLQHMDGLTSSSADECRPVFMAATNNLSQVDPAFLRRLRIHVAVPLPDAEAIETLIRRETSTTAKVSRAFVERCVAAKLSGSDVTQLCVVASYECADHEDTVEETHLEKALDVLLRELQRRE